MFKRPRLRNHWGARRITCSETLLLTDSGDSFILEGRLYTLLMPYLDGQHTPADIAAALDPELTILDVHYGLAQLAAHGYIIETDGPRGAVPAAIYDRLNGASPVKRVADKLHTVSVYGFGVDVQPFIELLAGMNVTVADDCDFAVVLVNDYLHEELAHFNLEAIQRSRAWILAKPVGAVVWVGPVFRPGRTACWSCLALRLRESQLPAIRRRKSSCAPVQAALDLIGVETLKCLSETGSSECDGRLATLDMDSFALENHVVVQRTDCRACSALSVTGAPAWCRQERHQIEFESPDEERSVQADVIYAQYRHHISRVTGVVHSVHPAWHDPESLFHVWIAEHNFSIRCERGTQLRWTRASRSVGKGETQEQARVSALGEALERYSGVFRGDEPRTSASYLSLGRSAVHPNACMQFSARQYQLRDEWNQRESGFNWVPEPFDEDQEIEWTPVWSLTHREVRYVPTAYLYYKYPVADDHDFCRADSNGNAAGATKEEALLRGFLEVVERDSVALWWYNRVRRPEVAIESFEQPYLMLLRRAHRNLGRELWVLDITGDFGIPTYAAVSRMRSGEPKYILGFGAHLDAGIALSRAVTEANQFIRAPCSPFTATETANLEFLLPDGNAAPRHAHDFFGLCSGSVLEQIQHCVSLAAARGLETLVLDQTRTDVGLPVVKVIIPGMRSFWARFGPGRLYTVPVELDWLGESREETELNPAHLTI